MTRRWISLLVASIWLLPFALLPVSATAGQTHPGSTASPVPMEIVDHPVPTPQVLQSEHLFDQQELDELAALEAENAELQEQTAGFFGPRVGTVIIIAILLIVLL